MNGPDAPCATVYDAAYVGGIRRRANFVAARRSLKCGSPTCRGLSHEGGHTDSELAFFGVHRALDVSAGRYLVL